MTTQYYTASSLDGFIADRDNSLDWLFQRFSEPGNSDYPDFIRDVGAIAMGATTYEWVMDHEVRPKGTPWPYSQASWVFTTRERAGPAGADIRFVKGDVRPVHEAMVKAAGGKNIWLVGGGELVGQFHDAGLLDELIVIITSVTLGAGAPLLPRMISNPPLKLLSVEQRGDGFAALRYAVRR